MANNAIGIDVSKWQGRMDWVKARAAGARFAYIRAGSTGVTGGMVEDSQFRNNVLAADVLPVGYYWYFNQHYSGKAQAEKFIEAAGGAPWHLPPAVDAEVRNIWPMTPYKASQNLMDFCGYVTEGFRLPPIIYTRGELFNSAFAGAGWLGNRRLWIARYSETLAHPWADAAQFKPFCWGEWDFWQYSADKNGRGPEFGAESRDIDVDRFNGDEAAFVAWVAAHGRGEAGLVNTPALPVPLTLEERVTALEGAVFGTG